MKRTATAKKRAPEPEEKHIIAAHADHCRDDFIFPRTQSLKMRDAKWESRLPPLRRTLLTIAANVAADVVGRIG